MRASLAPQATRLPVQFVSAQHLRHRALLDFLRRLRIKNAIENPMSRTLFRISLPALSFALLFLVTGCGEDPRFSAQTQYLGGAYGNAEGGPPRDTVSYWDGDNASGSPSVKISLGEQRAYFYKGGVLVGVSQLSTGREGLNTPLGHLDRKSTRLNSSHHEQSRMPSSA